MTKIELIEIMRVKQGLHKTKLCRSANVSIEAYYSYLKGSVPSVLVVERLGKALGLELEFIFRA